MFQYINLQLIFFLIILFFLVGAILSLVNGKNDKWSNILTNIFAISGAGFGLLASLRVLFLGETFQYSLSTFLPNFSIAIRLDMLSAIFLFIISLIAIISSIFGLGYLKHYYKKYNIGSFGFFYNLFILGMILVVTASNAIFFLISWELMSLASYFLVIFEHKEQQNIKAGSIYFIMTHIGTAFIILSFLLLYKSTGSFDFEIIKNNFASVPLYIRNMVFIFSLIGFGTKAGIIPLHNWLPKAHPATPSHVSALMSGVMIKTGIYMFIRMFFDIFSQPELWLGLLVLIIGAISALFGVLYALSEHDIKKLLAYHSIENIGIILLGIGSALIFKSLELNQLVILGLVAALYHTLNHAIFKSLLFLGAGSVISETGTQNIEKYGGLIKLMPYTAIFFLIGSMAISALPPLNGFFSEWLTYQSLFYGLKSSDMLTQVFLILSIVFFALTSGLAAACFVKVFGVTFLAKPRSEITKEAKEVSASLKIAMLILSLLTILFGFFSGFITSIIMKVVNTFGTLPENTSFIIPTLQNVAIDNDFANVSMPNIFLLLITSILLLSLLISFFTRKNKVRIANTWDCGINLSSRMEITATGFSRSIITIFKRVLRPTQKIDEEYHDTNLKYFIKTNTVTLGIHDVYETYFNQPLHKILVFIGEHIKKIQSGNENAYILYIFIALTVLIINLTLK